MPPTGAAAMAVSTICERPTAVYTEVYNHVTMKLLPNLNAAMDTACQNHGFVTGKMTAKTEVTKSVVISVTEPATSGAGTEDAFRSQLFATRTTTAATEAMKRFAER